MNHFKQWLQDHHKEVLDVLAPVFVEPGLPGRAVLDLGNNTVNALGQATSKDGLEFVKRLLESWGTELRRIGALKPNGSLMGDLLRIQSSIMMHIRSTTTAEEALDVMASAQNAFRNFIMTLNELEASARHQDLINELETIRRSGDRLDRQKSDFISVAAHELKTPLTLIEGYANMLRGELPETEHPRGAVMLNGISNGTQRLREIIEDMIDVSMIDMEVLDLYLQPVWIRRLLEIAVTSLGKFADERHITIETQYNTIPDVPTAGDPERLYQVFEKVIENAIKYTPDNGQLTIYGGLEGGKIEVVIEDTGVGIDSADLDLIFEKFFSLGEAPLHSSSRTGFKGGGPGLGLAIARGIVEAHDGTIWAESAGYDEDKLPGSKFHIVLPVREASISDREDDDVQFISHPALSYPLELQPETED